MGPGTLLCQLFGIHSTLGLRLLETYYKSTSPVLPGPSREGVWLGGESAYRTYVNDIARQLRAKQFLYVGSNLHVAATAGRSQVFHAGDLIRKPAAQTHHMSQYQCWRQVKRCNLYLITITM